MSNFNGVTDMKSFFIGKYEIKLPIIQGGMGVGVSLNGLASASGTKIENTSLPKTPKNASTDSDRRSAKPAKKHTA